MNAGDKDINVAVGTQFERVAPGLSFRGYFPGQDDHAEIVVTDGSCNYRYPLPNLNLDPWKSLIGDSIKFRWFSGGRMVAYPPTPDVQKLYNPERASTDDEARTIQPVETTCG
jgi:hypothetical protein